MVDLVLPEPTAPAGAPGIDAEPQLGLSSLCWSLDSGFVAVGAWDGVVRVFAAPGSAAAAASSGKAVVSVDLGSPVLSVVWLPEQQCVVGTLDGRVMLLRAAEAGGSMLLVGRHEGAVRCLSRTDAQAGWVVSGSWDKNVCVWDAARAVAVSGASPAASEAVAAESLPVALYTLAQPGKVFAMDCTASGTLVVATAGRHVYLWDLSAGEDLVAPMQRRESSLPDQTRAVACFADGTGYALSSVAGRVAIEYISKDKAAQAKKYAFKCHRQKLDRIETIYAVNTLAVHAQYGTFATGGSDGVVCVWDALNKKRVSMFPPHGAGVAAAAFSPDGAHLAVAASYAFDEGERDDEGIGRERIVIHPVTDALKPRARTASNSSRSSSSSSSSSSAASARPPRA